MSAWSQWVGPIRDGLALIGNEFLPEAVLTLTIVTVFVLARATFVGAMRMATRHASQSDAHADRLLSSVAALSGVYDVALGLALLLGRDLLMRWFEVPAPFPPIHADLNGVFTMAIGIGYFWPTRQPQQYRWYLWLMGPALKGIGALGFLVDHVVRHSPDAFLLFAITDGCLALLTGWALLATRRTPPPGQ